jgi:hypothetical protein
MAFSTQSDEIPNLPAIYGDPDAVVSPSPTHASSMHVVNLGFVHQASPRRSQEFSATIAASTIFEKHVHLPFQPCRASEHFSTITIDSPQTLSSSFRLWWWGIYVNRFAKLKATNPSTL